jgi:phage FluMu gp28-like protein
MPTPTKKPRVKATVPLLDWQRQWIEDRSRFRLVVASVQTGKSFVISLDEAMDAFAKPRRLKILLSASERQSLELMEKVKAHTHAWDAKFEDGYFGDTSIAEHRVILPNESRLIALPANPDTARGYSGDVVLDEFGLHRDSRAIWAAMMTRATRGYRVSVSSTFKGTDNKFYELAKTLGLHEGIAPAAQPVTANGWSGHWVDIYAAVAQGLAVDIEAMRQAIDDEEIWLQDYCNVPMSGAENYIPLELVLACESSDATIEWDGRPRPGLSAGFDVARKRDASVIVIGEELGDVVVVRGMQWLDRMKFADQRKICRDVATVIEASGGRFAVDATGIGAQLAEELHDEFPCVEAVEFGSAVETGAKSDEGKAVKIPVKEHMAALTKRRFEDRTLRIPESPRLRRACQAVKRYVGPTGAIRLDAPRTDKGHADEFWALALLVAALTGNRSYVPLADCQTEGTPVLAGLMERSF